MGTSDSRASVTSRRNFSPEAKPLRRKRDKNRPNRSGEKHFEKASKSGEKQHEKATRKKEKSRKEPVLSTVTSNNTTKTRRRSWVVKDPVKRFRKKHRRVRSDGSASSFGELKELHLSELRLESMLEERRTSQLQCKRPLAERLRDFRQRLTYTQGDFDFMAYEPSRMSHKKKRSRVHPHNGLEGEKAERPRDRQSKVDRRETYPLPIDQQYRTRFGTNSSSSKRAKTRPNSKEGKLQRSSMEGEFEPQIYRPPFKNLIIPRSADDPRSCSRSRCRQSHSPDRFLNDRNKAAKASNKKQRRRRSLQHRSSDLWERINHVARKKEAKEVLHGGGNLPRRVPISKAERMYSKYIIE